MTIWFRDIGSTCLDNPHDTQSKDMARRNTVVVSRDFESLMIRSCCPFSWELVHDGTAAEPRAAEAAPKTALELGLSGNN